MTIVSTRSEPQRSPLTLSVLAVLCIAGGIAIRALQVRGLSASDATSGPGETAGEGHKEGEHLSRSGADAEGQGTGPAVASGAGSELEEHAPALHVRGSSPPVDPERLAAWQVASAPPKASVVLTEARTRVRNVAGKPGTSTHDLLTWRYWWEDRLFRIEGVDQIRIRDGPVELVFGHKRIPFMVRAELGEARGIPEEPFVWLRWISRLMPRLKPDPNSRVWRGVYPLDDPWRPRRWAPFRSADSEIVVGVDGRLGIPTTMQIRAPGALGDRLYTRYTVQWFVGSTGSVLPRRVTLERGTIALYSEAVTQFFDWSFPDTLDWDKLAVLEVRAPIVIDARRGGSSQDRYEVVLDRHEDALPIDVRACDAALALLRERVDQPWIDAPLPPRPPPANPSEPPITSEPTAPGATSGGHAADEDVADRSPDTLGRGRPDPGIRDESAARGDEAEAARDPGSPALAVLGIVIAAIGLLFLLRVWRRR